MTARDPRSAPKGGALQGIVWRPSSLGRRGAGAARVAEVAARAGVRRGRARDVSRLADARLAALVGHVAFGEAAAPGLVRAARDARRARAPRLRGVPARSPSVPVLVCHPSFVSSPSEFPARARTRLPRRT